MKRFVLFAAVWFVIFSVIGGCSKSAEAPKKVYLDGTTRDLSSLEENDTQPPEQARKRVRTLY